MSLLLPMSFLLALLSCLLVIVDIAGVVIVACHFWWMSSLPAFLSLFCFMH